MELILRKGSSMKKRILCLALVMVMVFTLLPMSAFAENGNATTEPTMDVGGYNGDSAVKIKHHLAIFLLLSHFLVRTA